MELFCRNWLKSWTGNNHEKLLSFYHPDIFYIDPAHKQGIQGKQALATYLKKLLSKYPEWVWQMKELHPTNNGFCLLWEASSPSGWQERGMDLIELTDQKIIRNEVFFDPSSLKTA